MLIVLIKRTRLGIPALMMLAIILGIIFLGAPNRDAQAQDDDKTAYPERLAGYDVLNVRDADNTQCYSKPEPMFVVKMAETSIDNLMSSNDFDLDDIKEAIVAAGHPENSGIILAGPSATKAKELEKHSDWNDLRSERGCVKFGNKTNREHSHNRTDGVPTPNTFYHYEPGLAVIVDDEIAYNSNHNAQSVDLIAPTVGDNQNNFSAFLNNGCTTGGDLLQSGFYFEAGAGYLVWADEEVLLEPQVYGMDYIVGDQYYHTISYTNNVWLGDFATPTKPVR